MARMMLFTTCFMMVALSTVYSMIPELLNRGRQQTLPVQMDMISRNSITICTGNRRTLSCREGANIAVTDVFWGRLSDQICPSDDGDPVTDCDASPDTLSLVREECEGKRECNLIAKHNKLQKNGSLHCPGVNKYLITKFTCMPESKGILLCDSGESEISCEAGWIMQLADVFWGRRSSSKACGMNDGLECDASDGAASYLRRKCNGKRKCLVQNNPEILDPKKKSLCSDAEKFLLVNYICTPPKDAAQRFQIHTNDDDQNSLQEESSKELMGILENQVKSKPMAASFTTNKEKSSSSLPDAAISTVSHTVPTIAADKSKKAISQVKNENSSEDDETLEKKSGTSSQAAKEIDDSSIDTSSVRSILSRAKNILKTLDLDSASDVRRKRTRIARPQISLRRNQQKRRKKSKIGRIRQNKKRNTVVQSYPDNFILKSWYGY